MRENSIFTVTPPDMMLPGTGPIITVVSSNKNFLQQIENLYENIFKTTAVTLYFTDGPVIDKNSAWLLGISKISDTVYVDLSDTNELGIIIGLMHSENTVFICNNTKRKELIKVLNCSRDRYTLVEDVSTYADMILEGAKNG